MRHWSIIFIVLLSFDLQAQDRCGAITPSNGNFENWISTKASAHKNRISPITLHQIPVVIHVFHKGEPVGTGTNLSEERIKTQIDILTADFRRMNADASNTPAVFLPIAADTEIEFVLAKQDPAGTPTNGIVRVRGSKDTYSIRTSDLSLIRSESFWPTEHYLNIVVANVVGGTLGYASFPTISLKGIPNKTNPDIFDGVLIDFEYFGINSSAPIFQSFGRTLTHEVGHFLGLKHIWGDSFSCDVDDFVADTPAAKSSNNGYSSPCTFPKKNPASPVCIAGEPDMFQNYMDYTNDVCMNLFTQGQKIRMRVVIENALARTSLTTSPGLIEPKKFVNDLAAVNILSPSYSECSTNFIPTLRIENQGTTKVTTYNVQAFIAGIPHGAIQTINKELPPLSSDTVHFSPSTLSSTPTSISFQISNVNGGSDGNTSNNKITQQILSTHSIPPPFQENFESTLQIRGKNGSIFPWETATAPKSTPTNQAFIFKAHKTRKWFDENTNFKTPTFDLTGLSSGDLRFSYAYANRANTCCSDGLMIKASVDCGETFPDVIFSSFGPDLATAPNTDTYFIPANPLEWKDVIISITKYRNMNNVQFAFVGINGGGNNLYIDDIHVIETHLFKNDIKISDLDSPLITCAESSRLDLKIKNTGSEVITSFDVKYQVNGTTTIKKITGLDIASQDYSTISIDENNLNLSDNNVSIEVTLVNGTADEYPIDNVAKATITRNILKDEYPLSIDFESADHWIIASSSLLERTQLASNGVLKVNGFGVVDLGKSSWFVSPRLNTGGLDKANLKFRASYASRDMLNDRLQVLLSTDCGESYPTTLLDANSASLAVTSTTKRWAPVSESDWKEYSLDLSHSFFFDESIRIAFVFTSGGGNDLFIDDIRIQGNEPPTYKDILRIYPNPATSTFNIGLNLPQKESVNIRLMDMSGRIIFEEDVDNAFNQILNYKVPHQGGLYLLKIEGSKFSTLQKLFINR